MTAPREPNPPASAPPAMSTLVHHVQQLVALIEALVDEHQGDAYVAALAPHHLVVLDQLELEGSLGARGAAGQARQLDGPAALRIVAEPGEARPML